MSKLKPGEKPRSSWYRWYHSMSPARKRAYNDRKNARRNAERPLVTKGRRVEEKDVWIVTFHDDGTKATYDKIDLMFDDIRESLFEGESITIECAVTVKERKGKDTEKDGQGT